MSGWRIPRDVEQHIRARAAGLCEYRHADERWQYVRFAVDHVQPRASGGADTPDNLALACFHCNRRKFDRADGIDPATAQSVAYALQSACTLRRLERVGSLQRGAGRRAPPAGRRA